MSADEVVAADVRAASAGLTTSGVEETICCHAEKIETWIEGPRDHRWEWYVKQADHDGRTVGAADRVRRTIDALGKGGCRG